MAFDAIDLPSALILAMTPIVPTYTDFAVEAALPYAVLTELGENYEYFSRSVEGFRVVFCRGDLQVSLFAASRETCRALGRQLISLLDDTMLIYATGTLKYINPSSSQFVPNPQSAPGSPAVFQYLINVHYNEQRTL